MDLDPWQLVGEHLRGRELLHTQHDQGVEVAGDLSGLGPRADTRLDVAPGLGVGGDLKAGAARLVDHRDELVADQLVELIGMQADAQLLRCLVQFRQAAGLAVLVEITGDRDEVGEHRVADRAGHGGIRQRVQTDIHDRTAADHRAPVEDGARILGIGVVG